MWRIAFWLAIVMTAFGCSTDGTPLLREGQSALRQYVHPKFVWSDVPKEREQEFPQMVAAFAEGRSKDEFVLAVKFVSTTEAHLWFSDSGPHGGGFIRMKKIGEKWTVEMKAWYV